MFQTQEESFKAQILNLYQALKERNDQIEQIIYENQNFSSRLHRAHQYVQQLAEQLLDHTFNEHNEEQQAQNKSLKSMNSQLVNFKEEVKTEFVSPDQNQKLEISENSNQNQLNMDHKCKEENKKRNKYIIASNEKKEKCPNLVKFDVVTRVELLKGSRIRINEVEEFKI